MNINGSKASNVLGAKTARACDSCLLKRARWFCAADDAFLCQSCDTAVHSANQLASRHDRVRLETSLCKLLSPAPAPATSPATAPAWHQGFTKKARTPRHTKSSRPATNHHHQLPLVPEIGADEAFAEENEEQLFCRVPDFDDDDFCVKGEELGFGMSMVFDDDDRELNLEELLSSCDDEFAADVESLLGAGIVGGGNAAIDGLLDENKRVKIEEKYDDNDVDDEIACHFNPELDVEINWDFDCKTDSPIGEVGEEAFCMVKIGSNIETENEVHNINHDNKMNINKLLRLNYEAVIAAWGSSVSPWTDGIRPQFDIDEFMGGAWYEDEWGAGKAGVRSIWREKDQGREARVSRYREKRRTRLFSKKIRYEVRKLNAEKRPRMKGRFVKRTMATTTFLPSSSSSSSLPYHHQHLTNKYTD